MFAGEPDSLDLAGPIDSLLDTLPAAPAVFLLHPEHGQPYLGRTSLLGRRVKRLLRPVTGTSKLLNLRGFARRLDYWLTASSLESGLILYELAKRHLGAQYLRFLKLRMPPYVRLVLSNPFPRTLVTNRLTASRSLLYGPFRSRANAERFERELLDLFQLRRCADDLSPSAGHPGCIYGEMHKCLRPCQMVVTLEEYASETARVAQFLSTSGKNSIQSIEQSRDRLSAEMQFEAAASQHSRLERIYDILKLRDELAAPLESHAGIAVTRSSHPLAVNLWFAEHGTLSAPHVFETGQRNTEPASIDARLRQIMASRTKPAADLRTRQEHLALLARWYYSTWRDGEFLPLDSFSQVPFRKLVGAISRTFSGTASPEH